MPLSDQTQSDLAAVLETLEQRLYELSECAGGAPATEVGALQVLRENVAGLLRGVPAS